MKLATWPNSAKFGQNFENCTKRCRSAKTRQKSRKGRPRKLLDCRQSCLTMIWNADSGDESIERCARVKLRLTVMDI
jgi:hypothetical protein